MKTHDPLAGETWSRRDFLRGMNAAALAALAGGEPRPVCRRRAGQASRAHRRHAASCSGWPAAWRLPRRSTPSGTLRSKSASRRRRSSARSRRSTRRSTASRSRRAWSTSRQVLDRGTLIRSHVVADLGNILHSRHQYHWHTGYVPPQTVAAPHLGSWIAKVRGPEEPGDPGLHQHRPAAGGARRVEELKAFTTAGFFGSEYGPFNLPYPLDAMAAVRPPKGMTRERFARREKTYRRLVKDEPPGRPGERLPPGVDGACDGQRPPAAQLAGARRVRPVEGAEGELRPLQHRPVRPGLPAGPPADRGRRTFHRGDDRVRPVPELGHPRERPRHVHRDEASRSTARSPSSSSTWKRAGCSTARWSCWPASSAAT